MIKNKIEYLKHRKWNDIMQKQLEAFDFWLSQLDAIIKSAVSKSDYETVSMKKIELKKLFCLQNCHNAFWFENWNTLYGII